MHNLVEKHINDFFRDITGLGGIWFYAIFVGFVFLLARASLAVQLVAALIIIYVVAILVRSVYFKDRPFHEFHRNFFERIDASSFPSIHAARATVLTYIISAQIPEVTFLAVITAVLICASRIYLRKHYLVDVIGGVILGALTAVAVTNFL